MESHGISKAQKSMNPVIIHPINTWGVYLKVHFGYPPFVRSPTFNRVNTVFTYRSDRFVAIGKTWAAKMPGNKCAVWLHKQYPEYNRNTCKKLPVVNMTSHMMHFRHQYVAVHIWWKANFKLDPDEWSLWGSFMNFIIKMVMQMLRFRKHKTIYRKIPLIYRSCNE